LKGEWPRNRQPSESCPGDRRDLVAVDRPLLDAGDDARPATTAGTGEGIEAKPRDTEGTLRGELSGVIPKEAGRTGPRWSATFEISDNPLNMNEFYRSTWSVAAR